MGGIIVTQTRVTFIQSGQGLWVFLTMDSTHPDCKVWLIVQAKLMRYIIDAFDIVGFETTYITWNCKKESKWVYLELQ